jgi:hypothetical protein|tara:strand:+ start:1346 stop:1558 length:213 start_codon:yes stop_codon:yes gene_type:complete
MAENDIQQRDFSGKRLKDMSALEREEMERRFMDFFRSVGGQIIEAPKREKEVRKWNPLTDGKAGNGKAHG